MIVTVVGPTVSQDGLDSDRPILLGATGPVGERPDGADAGVLAQFTDDGQFPDPSRYEPPSGTRTRLTKGLILELFHADPDQSYKGARLHRVELGEGDGEVFHFPASSVSNRADTQGRYLELSTMTQAVYLIRVVDRSSGARLVTAIDFQDQSNLDEWQCYFLMEALHRTLGKLTLP